MGTLASGTFTSTSPRATVPRFAIPADAATAPPDPTIDLAAELAHDIRSPIAAVMSLAELLQKGGCGPVTAQQQHNLNLMLQAARGISQLANDLVSSAKLGELDGREAIAPFSVPELLASVGTLVKPIADCAGLKLLVRNHAPVKWLGQRAALTRVLLNLTTNAIKYTDQGSVEFGAHLVAPEHLEFFVRDTGIGFEITRSERSGLGLAICRRLLRAAGSTLEVEPIPGEGTMFRFVLGMPAHA
jgi:signal transduction histidine kinase